MSGHFSSETVFNLSRKVLTDTDIKILEKGFDFAAVQRKIIRPELRSDYEEFCRRVRTDKVQLLYCECSIQKPDNEILSSFSIF